MAVSPTPPLISVLPPAPLPTDAEAVFDAKAGVRLTAEEVMVAEQNAALAWQAGSMAETKGYKEAAATSAGHAADSANAAADSATAATENGAEQVQLAAEQVTLATEQAELATTNGQEQVELATEQAELAAAAADTATAMAQAAGAAVGPPPVPNKFLGTDALGNPAWRDAGQKIGDALFTARAPDATYLPLNGGVYSQTAYAALFGIVGLISGSFAEVWAAVTSNAGSNAINAVETDGNGVWVAAGAAGAMVRSTDNGLTWTAVTSGFGADAINGLACDRASLWVAVGAAGKVTRSTDNGATWVAVTSGLAATDVIYSVASDRNSTFVAVYVNSSSNSHGALRSTDKGVAWSSAVINASATAGSKSIATDRKGTWISTSGSSQFYRSLDSGASWVQITGISGLSTNRIATDCNGVWVSGNSGTTAAAARSEDNGLTWASILTPLTAAISSIATDERGTFIMGVATTSNNMLRSTNGGLIWSRLTGANPNTVGASALAFGKDGVAISVGTAGAMQRSTPTYGYDTATQFKLPNQPAAIGLAAYIKAKDA
jgi:photosystem II stability/assembly factor-like uncharacterized protein